MGLIRLLIVLFIVAILTDTVLSYFPKSQENPYAKKLRAFSDYFLNPIRRLFPADMPFDVSPMIVVLGALVFMQAEIIIHWLCLLMIFIVIIDFIFSFIKNQIEGSFVARYRKLVGFCYKPIRRFLPSDIGFDAAPLITVIALIIIDKLW